MSALTVLGLLLDLAAAAETALDVATAVSAPVIGGGGLAAVAIGTVYVLRRWGR